MKDLCEVAWRDCSTPSLEMVGFVWVRFFLPRHPPDWRVTKRLRTIVLLSAFAQEMQGDERSVLVAAVHFQMLGEQCIASQDLNANAR